MSHTPVHTGAGYRCTICNVAWDQGDPDPSDCVGEGTQPIGPEEDGVRLRSNFIFASGDAEYLKDGDTGGRRFWPINPSGHGLVTPDPMKRQVQGTHYRNLAIQPTEFCQRNGLDFCCGSILKYLTRHRSKNGREDLCKAKHFVEIREAFPYHVRPPGLIEITMLEYVTRNNVPVTDAEALYRLEAYYNTANDVAVRAGALRLIGEIDGLIALYT